MFVHYIEKKHYTKAPGFERPVVRINSPLVIQDIESRRESFSNNTFNVPWMITTGKLNLAAAWQASISPAMRTFFNVYAEYEASQSIEWIITTRLGLTEQQANAAHVQATSLLRTPESDNIQIRYRKDLLERTLARQGNQPHTTTFTAHVTLQRESRKVYILTSRPIQGGFDDVFERDLSFTIEV